MIIQVISIIILALVFSAPISAESPCSPMIGMNKPGDNPIRLPGFMLEDTWGMGNCTENDKVICLNHQEFLDFMRFVQEVKHRFNIL